MRSTFFVASCLIVLQSIMAHPLLPRSLAGLMGGNGSPGGLPGGLAGLPDLQMELDLDLDLNLPSVP